MNIFAELIWLLIKWNLLIVGSSCLCCNREGVTLNISLLYKKDLRLLNNWSLWKVVTRKYKIKQESVRKIIISL